MNIYITHKSYLSHISDYMGAIKPTMTLVVVHGLVNDLFKVDVVQMK